MEADNSLELGVNLIAYIRAEMGLGTAGRGLAMALDSAGIPFNVINFEHANPAQHRDNSWRHKEADQSCYGFSVLAVNPDNLANVVARAPKELVEDRYTIGYWFWELPRIPDSWLPSFSLVNEVWVASRFVQDAVSLQSPVPVFRVPVPVRLAPTGKFSRRNFALPDRQFLFLSVSDTHSELARKNPLGAIQAFKRAFPGENKRVGLVVKISNVDSIHADHEMMHAIRGEIADHRNIYLLDRNMTREEIDGLLECCNAFVSLHRSEGFGLGPAEAMSLGKPVILTKWSGNVDYMTPENSIGIDYRLVALGKSYGPYPADQVWADPDLEQAADWMKQLVKDPGLAHKIGKLGQQTIKNDFSPEAIGQLIHDRLSCIKERRGAPPSVEKLEDDLESGAVVTSGAVPETVSLSIYSAGQFGYREDGTLEVPYETQRWAHLHMALEHGLGLVPLRLDPIKTPGLIDIAAIAVKSALGGEVLWKASGRGGLESLETGGSAMRIPHPRLARVFSYGDDPQIFLPVLRGPEFDGPLRLEIWLKIETRTEPIREAMSELAQATAKAWARARAANLSLPDFERDWGWEVKFNESQERLERLVEELDEVRRDLLAREETLARRDSELDRRGQELAAARKEVAVALGELAQTKAKLLAARQENALQKSALALKEDAIAVAGQELAASTRELTKIAGQLEVLKRQIADQQMTIDEFRARPFRRVLSELPVVQRFAKRGEVEQSEESIASAKEPEPPTFWLEHPTAPSPEGQKVRVSGWAVTPSGEIIEGVQALLNGETIPGLHALERADVAAKYKDRSDYLHSGFAIELHPPPGSHQITVQYLTRSAGWTTFCSFQHEVVQESNGSGASADVVARLTGPDNAHPS